MVYAQSPFDSPVAVLACQRRYTHRAAISNTRLISADAQIVAFRWKDYRVKSRDSRKAMRLPSSGVISVVCRFMAADVSLRPTLKNLQESGL